MMKYSKRNLGRILICCLGILFCLGTFAYGSPEKAKQPLEGRIIGIDPGHQEKGDSSLERIAPDTKEKKAKVSSGTRGLFTKVYEYELNLAVGLELRKQLETLGAKVIMTRTKNDVNISNSQRALLANENHCDMVIRIHANGSGNLKTRGYSILIPGRASTPTNLIGKSKRFGKLLDRVLKQNINIPSKGIVSRKDLTGFNWAQTPVVLLEMGYMSNKTDDQIMETKDFQKSVARSVGEALVLYFDEGK